MSGSSCLVFGFSRLLKEDESVVEIGREFALSLFTSRLITETNLGTMPICSEVNVFTLIFECKHRYMHCLAEQDPLTNLLSLFRRECLRNCRTQSRQHSRKFSPPVQSPASELTFRLLARRTTPPSLEFSRHCRNSFSVFS